MTATLSQVTASRRCTARANRTGERCQRWALHGLNVCRVHGGAAARPRAKRERIITEERINRRVSRLVASAILPDETPTEALSRLAKEGLALCAVLREHVSERGDVVDSNGQVSHVAQGYLIAIDRVARMLGGLIDRELASQDRAARIEEKDAELLIRAARSAAYAPRVGLSPEQATALLDEMQRRLLAAA